MGSWRVFAFVIVKNALAEPLPAQHLLHMRSVVPPPKGMDTVNHDKVPGSGYNPGSPLYERQQALKRGGGDAAASPGSAWNVNGPGWIVVILAVLIGACAIGGVFYLNRKYMYAQEPRKMPPPALPATSSNLGPQPHYSAVGSAYQTGPPPATIQSLRPGGYAPDRQATVLGTGPVGQPQGNDPLGGTLPPSQYSQPLASSAAVRYG